MTYRTHICDQRGRVIFRYWNHISGAALVNSKQRKIKNRNQFKKRGTKKEYTTRIWAHVSDLMTIIMKTRQQNFWSIKNTNGITSQVIGLLQTINLLAKSVLDFCWQWDFLLTRDIFTFFVDPRYFVKPIFLHEILFINLLLSLTSHVYCSLFFYNIPCLMRACIMGV